MHFELLENRTLLALDAVDEPAGEEEQILFGPDFGIDAQVALEAIMSMVFGAGVAIITASVVNGVQNCYKHHKVGVGCPFVAVLVATGLFGYFTALPLFVVFAPWNDSVSVGQKIAGWSAGVFGFGTGIACSTFFLCTGNARQAQQLGGTV